MTTKPNLFVYLSQPANDNDDRLSTEVTEQADDDYDAPNASLDSSSLVHQWRFSTVETREDTDDYDKDPQIHIPSTAFGYNATGLTASSESYDEDKGLELLSFPRTVVDETGTTKVLGDTYDDQSVESLSVPYS
jgi:hypothetical protein